MDTAFLIELYGYLGSVLVVVAMLMASLVKLRIFSTIGSVISGSYALLIGSFPLALMNGCLIVINVYNLFKLLKVPQKYEMFEAAAEDGFTAYFLDRYMADIRVYFPGFDAKAPADTVYVICCEGVPAGILMGRKMEDGVIDVTLDYAVPAYRDCRSGAVGAFLYPRLAAQGIRALTFSQEKTAPHCAYMTKLGFVEQAGVYTKKFS